MRGGTFRSFGAGSVAVAPDVDRGFETRCFADEVVVDFPSVAPAVDRMRGAFLVDERRAALSAAVTITCQEARDGALIPLDVSVRCACADCGGRGEAWAEPCVRCQGSGLECRPHQVRVAVPPGVADGACFSFTITPRHNPPTRVDLRVLIT